MQLSDIVPWGRSYAEYAAMFALSDEDVQKRILGCGDGPASFNAECTALGGSVISVDPIYEFGEEEIAIRFEQAAPDIISQVGKTLDSWVWSHHGTPEGLLACRRSALECFLADYETGKAAGRYLAKELPTLPFENGTFDLALCSHLLFLFSAHLSEEFHVLSVLELWSVLELCRVAKEVRIFPLLTLEQKPSPHLPAILQKISLHGLDAEVIKVPYEFQRGGNEMLVVKRG